MKLVERLFELAGYERKADRARVTELGNWPGGRRVYSGQDLPSDLATYRALNWVYTCVHTMAQDIAGLPLRFYRGRDKDKKEVADHFIARLFEHINPQLSPYEFWFNTVGYYLLSGQAYAGIEKNNGGRPAEIYPLRPDRVEIMADPQTFISGIKYRVDGGRDVLYGADEIFWIRSFNPENDYYGLSPIEPLHSPLLSDMNATEYERNFFKNDATPPGFLIIKGKLQPDARKRLIDGFEARHKGVENAGRIAIIEGDGDYKPAGQGPKDGLFKELREMRREDVLAAFGMPPGRVGLHKYSNYANLEAQLRLYWTMTLVPIVRLFDSALNSTFIRRYDPDVWCAHDFSQVEALRENEKDKADTAAVLVSGGIKTPNEIRAEYYNLPAHPDGDELRGNAAIPAFALNDEKNLSPAMREFLKWAEQDYAYKNSKPGRNRNLKWYAKDARRRRHELALMKASGEYLEGQAKRLARVLKKLSVAPGPDDIALFFDEEAEKKSLLKIARPLISDAVADAGQEGIDEARSAKGYGPKRPATIRLKQEDDVDITGVFDVSDPAVSRWISANSAELVSEVTETTKKKIRKILKEGYDDGWSVQQLAEAIQDKLDGLAPERAWTIAQTEMGAAMNKGTVEGSRQTGLKLKKKWLSTPDEKTRESHRAAGEAEAIGLDEKFPVGSDLLDHPGDPRGSAEETINCRCAVEAVEDQEEE